MICDPTAETDFVHPQLLLEALAFVQRLLDDGDVWAARLVIETMETRLITDMIELEKTWTQY